MTKLKLSYFGSVINSNRDCSHKIKRRLRLGRGIMEELGKISKSKDLLLETKAKVNSTLYSQILCTDVDSDVGQ